MNCHSCITKKVESEKTNSHRNHLHTVSNSLLGYIDSYRSCGKGDEQ
jgi:hypothetical protein